MFFTVIISSCATKGPVWVKIDYSFKKPTPFVVPMDKKIGILVSDVRDIRERRDIIGDVLGYPLLPKEAPENSIKLAIIANLRRAGFEIISPEKKDTPYPIYTIDCKIKKFWVDVKSPRTFEIITNANIEILVRIFNTAKGTVLWEGNIQASSVRKDIVLSEENIERAITDCVSDAVENILFSDAFLKIMKSQ